MRGLWYNLGVCKISIGPRVEGSVTSPVIVRALAIVGSMVLSVHCLASFSKITVSATVALVLAFHQGG